MSGESARTAESRAAGLRASAEPATGPPNAQKTGTIRNKRLAGSTHPKTGVPFNNVGFPVFESAQDVKLPENLQGPTVSDTSQFKYATGQLAKELQANPALRKNFTQEQLDAIAKGEAKIPGYTWHHNEDGITLQLVASETHGAYRAFGWAASDWRSSIIDKDPYYEFCMHISLSQQGFYWGSGDDRKSFFRQFRNPGRSSILAAN